MGSAVAGAFWPVPDALGFLERQAQCGFDFSRNSTALRASPDSAEAETTLLAQLHGAGLRCGRAPSGIGNLPSEMNEAPHLRADTTRLQRRRCMAVGLVWPWTHAVAGSCGPGPDALGLHEEPWWVFTCRLASFLPHAWRCWKPPLCDEHALRLRADTTRLQRRGWAFSEPQRGSPGTASKGAIWRA